MIDVRQERDLSATAVLARQLAPVASAMRNGKPVVVQGVLEATRPWVLSALLGETGVTLVVTTDALAARSLFETLQRLYPHRTSALLPERDPLPFEWLTSDPTVTGARLSALLSLYGVPVPHEGRVIVASTRALLQATIPPEVLVTRRQRWLPGDRLRLASVLTTWMALGYDAVGVVEEPGTFCRRGGVLDVFPSHSDFPIRIELFDDEIESLHAYDPITQRSQEPIDELVLLPAREGLPDLGPHVADRVARLDASNCREDVQARWEESLQELREGRSFDGIELFVGHLHPPSNGVAYLPSDTRVVLCDVASIRDMGLHLDTQTSELRETLPARGDVPGGLAASILPWSTFDTGISKRPLLALESGASIELERGDVHDAPALTEAMRGGIVVELAVQQPPEFHGQMQRLLQQCTRWSSEGWQVLLATLQRDRLEEIFSGEELPTRRGESLRDDAPAGFLALVGQQLHAGWMIPDIKLVVLSDAELFGPQPLGGRHRRHRGSDRTTAAFLADLNVGDLIVHVDHGIGRFSGITRLDQGAGEREYLLLEYSGADRLYVPTDQLDRVSRYVGVSETPPALNKLGTSEWSRVKSRVKAAVQEVAQGLLRLYAQRLATPGFTFPPDTGWQAEMEAAFPFDETPDQLRAIEEVKSDLESGKIMDRLVCGDVGYGKTEVALRAAFKAVSNSKQVALLVPTTVLAQQHERTFRERLAAFPVQVGILSRFQSTKEQQATIEGLAAGTIDIVIGTHRLLQKDVRFKELGLVIIDEEQRFGVAHKEALKQLRADVHVLTLTATPIPRTLNMALVGVRDMSVIETPPEERQPVKTYIGKYDDRLVRDAILRELDRGGQVFVVHNRVQSIPLIAAKIAELVPEARVAIAHGQMREDKLEKVMLEFSAGDHNVLVSTTIIENGLDISNVNTIVINQATHLGLAQLYQLRGRVGRGNRRAYAYLLYSHEQRLPPLAEKRLRAVFEASELGAGFRIAMKDLEIRGAGNLLGADQHGHVAIIGFDLYTRMLEEAVQEHKGTVVVPPRQVVVDLRLPAFLPDDYVTDPATKIDGYRRLALATTLEDASAMRDEFVDRFGPSPEPVRNLLDIVEIKALCLAAGIRAVSASTSDVSIQFLQKRDYPRSALIRRFGSTARLGSEQLRLPRVRLGDGWIEALKEVLRMLC